MTTKAKLASSDSSIIVQKGGKLYGRELGVKEDDPIDTPHGSDDWLKLARIKYGLKPVVDENGNPDPDVGDDFPSLVPGAKDGETVYIVEENGDKEDEDADQD